MTTSNSAEQRASVESRTVVAGPGVNRQVIPHRPKWHGQIAAWLIYFFCATLSRTWRIRWRDSSGRFEPGRTGPVIFALWHNRLALTIALSRYPKFQNDRRTIAALVSASKDGALLTRALQYAGIEGVRGSSSRRGGQALLELARCMRRGLNVAITPDGPRGPKYRVREGIISLAQVSSAEIVPVGAKIYSRYTFKSWDAFQLPLPFSRIDLYFGPTISVPPEASDDQRIALAQEVADALKAINPD